MHALSTKEIEKTVEDMKKWTKKICSSKKKARKFLIDAGIYDADGNLTKQYRRNQYEN